jgi:hypothetical protein
MAARSRAMLLNNRNNGALIGGLTVGTIENQPPGHARHFLQKPLAPATSGPPMI